MTPRGVGPGSALAGVLGATSVLVVAGWFLVPVLDSAVEPSRTAEGEAHSASSSAVPAPDSEFEPKHHLTSPAAIREFVRTCAEASAESLGELEEVARHSDDPIAASHALRAVGRAGSGAFLAAVERLEDPELAVRQAAVRALGERGDPAALPHLKSRMKDEHSSIRCLALQAIGRIGGPQAERMLRSHEECSLDRVERAFLRTALSAAAPVSRSREPVALRSTTDPQIPGLRPPSEEEKP